MALLEIALAYALINEGSEVVNNPADHGGLTRYGITQKTLSTYLGRPASDAEVTNISQQTVSDIYRKLYWTPIRGEAFKSQKLATAVFDSAVLMGPSRAAKLLQADLKVKADGLIGVKTLSAIDAVDADKLLFTYGESVCAFLTSLCLADASQHVFFAGWHKRAHLMTRQS